MLFDSCFVVVVRFVVGVFLCILCFCVMVMFVVIVAVIDVVIVDACDDAIAFDGFVVLVVCGVRLGNCGYD